MKRTKLDKRFFDSTRGAIVTLLRGCKGTVDDLAKKLGLTDNAVRANLATLERDGLVQQDGVRRSHRKPHHTYVLTAEAEHLFPKAYDTVATQLITALKAKISAPVLKEILREVGRSLAGESKSKSEDVDQRIKKAAKALEAIGGSPRIEKENGSVFIRSESCPLNTMVAAHSEVCLLAESLVAEIVGQKVQYRCNPGEMSKCSFEISGTK